MRNPDWVRDEIILALDLYLRDKLTAGNDTHPEVVKLSKLLKDLPIFPLNKRTPTFRNENGVGMKIANFQRMDPTYKGAGLPAGNKLEEAVWDEFYRNPEKLSKTAQAIKETYKIMTGSSLFEYSEEEDFAEASEGRILTVLHRKRERSRTLVLKKKQQALKKYGKLDCEACGFNFSTVYGSRGEDFIECHHDKPLSTLGDGSKTKLDDLKLLCSNCHRMIHRSTPWLNIPQLKDLIAKMKS